MKLSPCGGLRCWIPVTCALPLARAQNLHPAGAKSAPCPDEAFLRCWIPVTCASPSCRYKTQTLLAGNLPPYPEDPPMHYSLALGPPSYMQSGLALGSQGFCVCEMRDPRVYHRFEFLCKCGVPGVINPFVFGTRVPSSCASLQNKKVSASRGLQPQGLFGPSKALQG